jgi:hypothetical protein
MIKYRVFVVKVKQLTLRLAEFLNDYNGRSKDSLIEIAMRFADQPHYVDSIITLVGDSEPLLADGATWLVKHHLENNGEMSDAQVNALLAQAQRTTYWIAQLHLCQSIRYLSIPSTQSESLYHWLVLLLRHKKPFVRAWSLDGLWTLAAQYPYFREHAEQARENAMKDSAASVRARAKNLKNL